MIWPNEFATWLVDILGVTSDNVVGITTMVAILLYFIVTIIVPASIGAWVIVKCTEDDSL